MKLRIHGNSLRFRISRSEVTRLADGQALIEQVALQPQPLTITLQSTRDGQASAGFREGALLVTLPGEWVFAWAAGEQIGIEHVFEDSQLHLIVEKDFKCLHDSRPEDADAFPNPLESSTTA